MLARLVILGADADVIALSAWFSIITKTTCLENGVDVASTGEILATDNTPRSITTRVRIASTFVRRSFRLIKQTSLYDSSLILKLASNCDLEHSHRAQTSCFFLGTESPICKPGSGLPEPRPKGATLGL